MKTPRVLLSLALTAMTAAAGMPPGFNEDESKVPPYTLPDPLVMQDGTPVKDAAAWQQKRRPELLHLFESEVYGKAPLGKPEKMTVRDLNPELPALNGKAVRKEVRVLFAGTEDGPKMDILMYFPAKADKKVPVFLGMNFNGNHAVQNDPAITLSTSWVPNDKGAGITANKAGEAARGKEADRWQVEYAIDHGYGVASIYYGDVDPDFDDGFANGIHAMTGKPDGPAAWGSIASWAWGLSRALDVLQQEPRADGKKVAVMGHSRLGKTSLWAGALDERFALVISNDSGAGGAALSRRIFGETVKRLNTSFPHWFCDNYNKYNDKESECPVDMHELLALIAPRPLLVHSATEDLWADPRGEFLSCAGADPVYKLLGTPGLTIKSFPEPEVPATGRLGYFLRKGKHDVTLEDWKSYVSFADQWLK